MATVCLFCMNQKGLSVLRRLISEYGPQVLEFVVTARDPSVDKDYYDEIRAECTAAGVRAFDKGCYPPVTSAFAFAIGWRWLLRDVSRLIIFHDSLLPQYRGFNPLVSYLLNKEPRIGVTALFAEEEFDSGPVIDSASAAVQYPIRIQQAIEEIIPLYCGLVTSIMKRILESADLQGECVLSAKAQDHALATYSVWRDEQDYRIDWSHDAEFTTRMIYAVGPPYRGASAILNDKLVRVIDAVQMPDWVIENRAPGKVIRIEGGCPVVICGRGLLKVTELIDDETQVSILPLTRLRTRFR